MSNEIRVVGARTNNLKNIDVSIPKNSFVVITGVSGSGKSSLAFDTIYAEGQRRFMESLSVQTRQLLEQVNKPDIESIYGLTPTIAIDQESSNRNPRSTVGTMSEIYHYLKLLFARVGQIGNEKVQFEPNHFSFNSPYGACPYCNGTGKSFLVDRQLIIPDPKKTLNSGAIAVWRDEKDAYYDRLLEKVCNEVGINMNVPVEQLDFRNIEILLYGLPDKKFKISYKSSTGKNRTRSVVFEGAIPFIEARTSEKTAVMGANKALQFLTEQKCIHCNGYKLNRESLQVRIDGRHIGQIADTSITDCILFFKELPQKLNEVGRQVALKIIPEILRRLELLSLLGVGYLRLDRSIRTLSGGEFQRIRLATQLGSDLSGITYVLDEPSLGLHQRDNEKLIESLKRLSDQGNTVIVVEHDLETMRQADYLIDIGPGAGEHGGELLATGKPKEVENNPNSIIGSFLSGKNRIEVPALRRKGRGQVRFIGCTANNLKNINFSFPVGTLIALCGVSGSGKSTMVNEIIYPLLGRKTTPTKIRSYSSVELIKGAIKVDQAPIGRNPRSNPATYTGIYDDIRNLFAEQKEARKRGYTKSRFSFNLSGGRCEECSGDGQVSFEMSFLPKLYVTCPVCNGKRYNEETLQILYKEHSIYDVLEMTVADALELFEGETTILQKLFALRDVGLDYVRLGQPATTLSGGEAQRVKLAAELYNKKNNMLYILDEPSSGLHIADIKQLLGTLQKIVDIGNTVLVIEHNLEIIKCADYVIDLGPEGGEGGGNIIAEGTPEMVALVDDSYTGQYLKQILC